MRLIPETDETWNYHSLVVTDEAAGGFVKFTISSDKRDMSVKLPRSEAKSLASLMLKLVGEQQ